MAERLGLTTQTITEVAKERTDVMLKAYKAHNLLRGFTGVMAKQTEKDMAELLAIVGLESVEPYIPISKLQLGEISLRQLVNLDDPGLNKGWHNGNGTFVFSGLWEQYTLSEIMPESDSASMVRAMELSGFEPGNGLYDNEDLLPNGPDEHGPFFGSQSLPVWHLDPSAYILINMVRRFEGKPLLDGFTKFPMLAPKLVNVTVKVGDELQLQPRLKEPYAAASAAGLVLGMMDPQSPIYDANDTDRASHVGTRYSVGVVPPRHYS